MQRHLDHAGNYLSVSRAEPDLLGGISNTDHYLDNAVDGRLVQSWSIFELPDPMFVAEAYLRVLGRPADPAGFLAHSRALRAGRSRAALLLDMQNSDEAKVRVQSCPSAVPMSVDPAMWPTGMPWTGQGRRHPRTSEILALQPELFVDALCAFVLSRRPSIAERHHLLARSIDLQGRHALLREATAELPWFRRGPFRKRRCGLLPRAEQAPMLTKRGPSGLLERTTTVQRRRTRNLDHLQSLSGTCLFTIATRSYLPYVRVLMRSLHQHHPEFHLVCLIVEQPATADAPDHADKWIEVVAVDLALPGFEDMTWRYDATELCTALKPMFFRWLLDNTKLERMFYIDPDICFFAPMKEACELLAAGTSLILTPHILAPLGDDGSEPSGQTILASGSFNLGFAAISRNTSAKAFVEWWADRLRTDATVDFAANRFTDQRWCDMAPSFVADLAILRHPGYNVAYWNLAQRHVHRDEFGRWMSNDEALVFFHFSGIDPNHPRRVSRHQDRLLWEDLGECQLLFDSYMADLTAAGWQSAGRVPRTYDSVDGVQISSTLRRLYREIHVRPASGSREQLLSEMLQLCVGSKRVPTSPFAELTPLMRRLHASRPELVSTFNLSDAQAARDYGAWFWSSGAAEHGLSALLRRAAQMTVDPRE